MKNKKGPSAKKVTPQGRVQPADSLERVIFCRHGRTALTDSNALMPSAVIEATELGRKVVSLGVSEEIVMLTSPLDRALKTALAIAAPDAVVGLEVHQTDALKVCNDAGQKDVLAFINAVTTVQRSRERAVKVLVCVTHEPFFQSQIMEIVCRALFGQEIHVTEMSAGSSPTPGGYRVLERNGSYHSTL